MYKNKNTIYTFFLVTPPIEGLNGLIIDLQVWMANCCHEFKGLNQCGVVLPSSKNELGLGSTLHGYSQEINKTSFHPEPRFWRKLKNCNLPFNHQFFHETHLFFEMFQKPRTGVTVFWIFC